MEPSQPHSISPEQNQNDEERFQQEPIQEMPARINAAGEVVTSDGSDGSGNPDQDEQRRLLDQEPYVNMDNVD